MMLPGGLGGSTGGSLFDFGNAAAKQALRRRNNTQGRSESTNSQRTSRSSASRYRSSMGGSYGGGGYSGYSGGGGGGGGRLGRLGRGGSPSGPPSLSQWLAKDADYQDQLRAFNRSLTDFSAELTRRKTKTGADYDAGVKQMGEQRTKDLQDILNDFASRGLLKSGLYGQRQADYEKQYNTNLSDLGRQNKSALADLTAEDTQFKRQQSLQKESARKEAARRRAEKYSL